MKVRELIELLSQHDPDMEVQAWHREPLDLRQVVHAADAKPALMKDAWFTSEKHRQECSEYLDALIDPTEHELYLLLSAYA